MGQLGSKKQKPWWLFSTLPLLAFSLMAYQNCGSTHSSTVNLSSLGCKADMVPVFADGYHKFLKANSCNNCHDLGGAGSGAFAQSDAFAAYQAFTAPGRGPSGIESKIKGGHQGYNFSTMETELSNLKAQWDQANADKTCSGGAGETEAKTLIFFEDTDVLGYGKKRVRVTTSGGVTKIAPDFQKKQTIEFSLEGGSINPSLPGAKLSIDVEVFYESDFFYPTHYLVSNPKILTPTQAIHIDGLTILLNGDPHLVTTYQGVNMNLEAGPESQSLDPGGAAAVFMKSDDESYDNSDTWSIQIENLTLL
ncbi:MAG: hypothetical protein KDD33_09070 [Bdellovibrionales bacterium]|nr:hypothetical protein [Bdellovibrionales bacterium]